MPPRDGATVATLTDDLLLLIFSLNAHLDPPVEELDKGKPEIDVDEEKLSTDWAARHSSPWIRDPGYSYHPHPWLYNHPLTILQRCSHVCASWRRLLLDSPTLWGGLIDLDFLEQQEEWREEILRRAQGAPLVIQGNLFVVHSHIDNFLWSLFQDKWTQFRKIEVALDMTGCPQSAVDYISYIVGGAIATPTQCLEYFSLNLQTPIGIFTNIAPSLRWFESAACFNVKAPWMRQLRRLSVRCETEPASFEALELLRVLHAMQRLENLELRNTNMDLPSNDNSASSIILPRLKHVAIEEEAKLSSFLLRHITPLDGRHTAIYATITRQRPLNAHEIHDFAAAVSLYIQQSPFGTRVSVTINRGYLSIVDGLAWSYPNAKFDFRLSIDGVEHAEGIHSAFTRAFACGDFKLTTTLKLEIHIGFPLTLTSAVEGLLRSFASVTLLKTRWQAFRVLATTFNNAGGLLPHLHKLRNFGFGHENPLRDNFINSFKEFYRKLSRDGSEFVLDLRNTAKDWDPEALDELEGLIVLYDDWDTPFRYASYRCSGRGGGNSTVF